MRTHPNWNAFAAYTDVRGSLHDSHRLSNVHSQIRRIGWTPNDQELFARWFYPDALQYSYDHLAFLRDNVAPFSQNPVATLAASFPAFATDRNLPYLLLSVGIVLLGIRLDTEMRWLLALGSPLLIAVVVNAVLTVVYKDPSYVQSCTLAAGVLLTAPRVASKSERRLQPGKPGRPGTIARYLVAGAGWACVVAGAGMLGHVVLSTSSANGLRRTEYANIREGLLNLERDGVIPAHALVISPAHGLPYDWSNPFSLDRPEPAYLDTGWITFSPSYLAALEAFGIQSLPDALLRARRRFSDEPAGLHTILKPVLRRALPGGGRIRSDLRRAQSVRVGRLRRHPTLQGANLGLSQTGGRRRLTTRAARASPAGVGIMDEQTTQSAQVFLACWSPTAGGCVARLSLAYAC